MENKISRAINALEITKQTAHKFLNGTEDVPDCERLIQSIDEAMAVLQSTPPQEHNNYWNEHCKWLGRIIRVGSYIKGSWKDDATGRTYYTEGTLIKEPAGFFVQGENGGITEIKHFFHFIEIKPIHAQKDYLKKLVEKEKSPQEQRQGLSEDILEEIIRIYDNWIHSRNSDSLPEVLRQHFKDRLSAPTSEERKRTGDEKTWEELHKDATKVISELEAELANERHKRSAISTAYEELKAKQSNK